jgi:hypothetical protein
MKRVEVYDDGRLGLSLEYRFEKFKSLNSEIMVEKTVLKHQLVPLKNTNVIVKESEGKERKYKRVMELRTVDDMRAIE